MQSGNNEAGILYIVATPIGNLADFSFRAVETLQQVDLIAAEDTRHARLLLQHYGITTQVMALHQHNEEKLAPSIIEKIKQGQSVALISDAGTPLLSDPGMPLVQMAKAAGVDVSPVPGACALIAALSASGLPVTKFSFEGFLPRSPGARKQFLAAMKPVTWTWVFYESSHRIVATLEAMMEILPTTRQCVIAREMTKLHETIVKGTLESIYTQVKNDPNMQKGEFVVLVGGADASEIDRDLQAEQAKQVLSVLLTECSVKTAAALAAKITGQRKKILYQWALELTNDA